MANWKKTMMAAAGGGGPYWILEYGVGSSGGELDGNEDVNRAALDSDDNIYVTGWVRAGPNDYQHATLNKVDTEGTFQLNYNYGGSNFAPTGKEISVDSSGNIAIGCDNFRTSDPGLIYTNSSGTVQWSKKNTMSFGDCVSCRFDSSGNVFVAGSSGEFSNSNYYLKLSSSGSLSNQLWVNMASNTEDVRGMTIDSSGNMIAVGFYYDSYYIPFLLKTNSSLGVTFLKEVELSNNFGWYDVVATDSSNNIYAAGQQRVGDSGNYQLVLSKFNSSGVHQWTQRLNGTTFSLAAYGVAINGNDDIFVVAGDATDSYIVKYNSSGTLQFQNLLKNTTSGSDRPAGGILIDSKGDLIVSGWGPTGVGNNDCWLAKLPSDGSKTGTYGDWTYETATLSAGTLTPTVSNKSYSSNSSIAYLEAATVNRYTTSYTTNLENV